MNHAGWLDAWDRGLVVPPFIDRSFSGSESPKKRAGLHAFFETTKADGGLFHVGRGEGA